MPQFKIAYNAATKVATVQDMADALPAGSTQIGTFDHGASKDTEGDGTHESHVFYHHVRDALYKLGELDMQSVTIASTTDYQAVWDVNVARPEEELRVGEKVKLVAAVNPPNASDVGLVWSSSKTAVATVSNTGEVTGVAEGNTVITVKSSQNPAKKAEVIVSVKP